MDLSNLLTPPDISAPSRILCIQPHPDDNEIAMGGTIAALAKKGCHVEYLTITNGDLGSADPTANPAQIARIRKEEAAASGQLLGVAGYHWLEKGDGTLSDVPSLALDIVRAIRKARAEVVFLPDPYLPYEGHNDHLVAGRAAMHACLMAGSHLYDRDYGLAPCAPKAAALYFTAHPNTVVDVSDTWEDKFAAMALHKSQMPAPVLDMYRTYFTALSTQLGQSRGFALGEGFKVLDPLHMHCFVQAMDI